jgi:hypothetical protein
MVVEKAQGQTKVGVDVKQLNQKVKEDEEKI